MGTRAELGVSWLCPALEDLAAQRPERTIHLYNGDTPDLLQRLERGDVDAIVASMRLTSPTIGWAQPPGGAPHQGVPSTPTTEA